EAMRGLGDDQAMRHAHNPLRFAQYHFNLARILVPPAGIFAGQRRRLDGGQIDELAFGFGNDLVRDNDDVTSFQPNSRGLEAVSDEFREIIARPDFGKSRYADDADLGRLVHDAEVPHQMGRGPTSARSSGFVSARSHQSSGVSRSNAMPGTRG